LRCGSNLSVQLGSGHDATAKCRALGQGSVVPSDNMFHDSALSAASLKRPKWQPIGAGWTHSPSDQRIKLLELAQSMLAYSSVLDQDPLNLFLRLRYILPWHHFHVAFFRWYLMEGRDLSL
jgi:hypothetical protein